MRVLLSAPARIDTSVLREVIEQNGAVVLDSHESPLGEWSKLGRVDAVVTVVGLADGTRSDTVLIEAGVALGRRLPLLALYEEDTSHPPIWPSSVTVARANLLNPEALRFHLKLFLAKARRNPAGRAQKPLKSSRNVDLTQVRRDLAQIREQKGRGLALEVLVANLFRASGLEIAEPPGSDRGFDLVVTLSEMAPSLGPIVIEVKAIASFGPLRQAGMRLHQIVLQERAAFGVLLFDDENNRGRIEIRDIPMVAVIGIDDLLDVIGERGSLSAVLLSLHNESVHGI